MINERPYNEVWTGHILERKYFKRNGASLLCIIHGYLRKASVNFNLYYIRLILIRLNFILGARWNLFWKGTWIRVHDPV